MRIISVTYINTPEFSCPEDWIKRIYAYTGVLEYLSRQHTVFSIEQINYRGEYFHKGVHYYFRNYGKRVSRFPFRLHKFIRQLNPDVVLVRGLHFPLQVILLRRRLGRNIKIIAEHHADRPFKGLKRILQRIADRCIDAYHFTSVGNAQEWLDAGIIHDKTKCCEISAGSTYFSGQDKEQSKQITGMKEGPDFIWAGRLNKNKDPLIVLSGFEKYLSVNTAARLHMIYQTDDLLPEIEKKIEESTFLKKAVLLHGYIPHDELAVWFSAADFFISGSHSESGGIALVEAMACGCIPIVTAIPSALKVTGFGKYGLYFQPGDAGDLFEKLVSSEGISINEFSAAIKEYFQKELSFEAIARKFYQSCENLMPK